MGEKRNGEGKIEQQKQFTPGSLQNDNVHLNCVCVCKCACMGVCVCFLLCWLEAFIWCDLSLASCVGVKCTNVLNYRVLKRLHVLISGNFGQWKIASNWNSVREVERKSAEKIDNVKCNQNEREHFSKTVRSFEVFSRYVCEIRCLSCHSSSERKNKTVFYENNFEKYFDEAFD